LEYVTPRVDRDPLIPFGTMPKASRESGSHLKNIHRAALMVPGPGYYNKSFLDRPFSADCKGGGFGKLDRTWGKHSLTPSVGQYKTESEQTMPRILGGEWTKRPNGQLHEAALARGRATPSFAKYDAEPVENRVKVMSFHTSTTQPRLKNNFTVVGPGHYNPNFDLADKAVPAYTAPKESRQNITDRDARRSRSVPAPGHVGIPEPTNRDLRGQKKHLAMLMRERDCPSRISRDCSSRASRDCPSRASRDCPSRASRDCPSRTSQ